MYELIQNANTKSSIIYNSDDKPTGVMLTVNDKYQHFFDHKSRITKFADQFGEEETNNRFKSGHFFFVNNQLADYREADYNGFIHNESSIDALMDKIGFQTMSVQKRHNYHTSTPVSDVLLYNIHHKKEMQFLPGDGGVFNTQLGFTWSPFQNYVKSVFELIRLVCSNGMVATDEFLSVKVPLINQWDDNIMVATKQIENRVHNKVSKALSDMSTKMANISTINLLNKHASTRLMSKEVILTESQRESLTNINNMTFVNDSNKSAIIGKFIASGLTQYDAYNIATEIASHSPECSGSSTRALQMIANQLVFDDNRYTTQYETRFKTSPFSDTDQAFFGAIAV